MKITEIKIRKNVREESNIFCFADIVFDDSLRVIGFKIRRRGTLEVLWPARYNAKENTFYPIVESVTETLKDEVEKAILQECENYEE